VAALRAAIAGSDALLLVGPEHNWSYSAVLKNAIDWCSRPKFASILAGRHVALGGASPGPAGTARAQEHLRQVLDSVRAHVLAGPAVAVGGDAAAAIASGELPAEVRAALRAQLAALRQAARAPAAVGGAGAAGQPASAVRSRPSPLAA
jgi:chromate reductase